MTLIVVNKIISKYKKDNEGKKVKNPINDKQMVDGIKIVRETIRLSEVKSAREYHSPNIYDTYNVKGGITVLYMYGDKSLAKDNPQIHINEDVKDFNKRTGAIEIIV